MLKDFFNLLYPKECAACNNTLLQNEHCICTICRFELPNTNFHLEPDNQVEKLFWGRVKLEAATSLYYFTKSGLVQKLLQELKYNNNTEVGICLGEIMGDSLKNASILSDIDIIIPIPLHPKKEYKRGYNQSYFFAKGISDIIEIPIAEKNLKRVVFTETQTNKTRIERWENVEDIFVIKNPDNLKGKHILLVDDVVTTGATAESCAKVLLEIEDVKVSFVSIAVA